MFYMKYNKDMNDNKENKVVKKMSEKKRFSLIVRLQSSDNALRGLLIFTKITHHFWVEIFFAILAIYLGFLLDLSYIEWAIIIFAIGLVFVSEAFNSAIEIDMDLTSPDYHPYARDTKDIAAGAVSLAVVVSGIMGLLVFLPKIISSLSY